MKNLIIIPLIFLLLSTAHFPRHFPNLNHSTIKGKAITNDYFKHKKTIVILMHLGCPPAMILLKDLQALEKNKLDSLQILIITENTSDQVKEFNSTEENIWSNMRKNYNLAEITFDVIAECEKSKIVQTGEDIIIKQQCRKLSRKLFTKSSPSIYFVDENSKISKKVIGYSISSNLPHLNALLAEKHK